MLYYFLFANIMSFVLFSTKSTGTQHSHSHPQYTAEKQPTFLAAATIAHGITYINLVLPLSCPSSSACHFVIPRLLGNCYLLKDFPPDCGKHKGEPEKKLRETQSSLSFALHTVQLHYIHSSIRKLHTYCHQ